MKRFQLVREEDETGISGTGVVAEGVQSTNGKCVLFWLSELKSVAIYDSIEELEAIHGHQGKTKVVWEGTPVYAYKSVPNFCECESPKYSSWSSIVITGVFNPKVHTEPTHFGAVCGNCEKTINLESLSIVSFEEYKEKYSPLHVETGLKKRDYKEVCVKCLKTVPPRWSNKTHYCEKEENEN